MQFEILDNFVFSVFDHFSRLFFFVFRTKKKGMKSKMKNKLENFLFFFHFPSFLSKKIETIKNGKKWLFFPLIFFCIFLLRKEKWKKKIKISFDFYFQLDTLFFIFSTAIFLFLLFK